VTTPTAGMPPRRTVAAQEPRNRDAWRAIRLRLAVALLAVLIAFGVLLWAG